MRNSSLSHLLNPDFLYSTLTFSFIKPFTDFSVLCFNGSAGKPNFAPISSSTLGNLSSYSFHKKQSLIRRRAPLLLAFLAIFCFGIGLGVQQIFPNTEVGEEIAYIKDSGQSRLGACTITEDQINLDLTLHSSPRIQIYIKHFGGEIVYRRDVNLGRQKKLDMDIDLTVLPKGLYMLKVESGDQQMVRLITRS